jgi:hypothetical protein
MLVSFKDEVSVTDNYLLIGFRMVSRTFFRRFPTQPSGAEVNAWSYTSTLPVRLHGVVLS